MLNVKLPSTKELFSIDALLAGKYDVHLLAGQHIVEADRRLLTSVYLKFPANKIPGPMKFKQAEIYINLTETEEAMIVSTDNTRLNLKNQFWDKVRLINFPHFRTVKILSMLRLIFGCGSIKTFRCLFCYRRL